VERFDRHTDTSRFRFPHHRRHPLGHPFALSVQGDAGGRPDHQDQHLGTQFAGRLDQSTVLVDPLSPDFGVGVTKKAATDQRRDLQTAVANDAAGLGYRHPGDRV
jgi:hypothetical protein